MSNNTKRLAIRDVTEQKDLLPAGRFSSWLQHIRSIEAKGADVPCGDCNACCRSSYFIHITPEETQTLARIPKELLFTAPGMPIGNVVLGYDKKGRCPMLNNAGKCSIYNYRPRTCRSYDCRIFPAAGIIEADDDKSLITRRIKSWKFSYETNHDRDLHSAVKAAVVFLREHAESLPSEVIPKNSAQLAMLAIKVYDVFIKYIGESGKIESLPPHAEIIKAVVESIEKFDNRCDT